MVLSSRKPVQARLDCFVACLIAITRTKKYIIIIIITIIITIMDPGDYVEAVEVRGLPSGFNIDTLWCHVGVSNAQGRLWDEDPDRHKYGGVIL
jgi:hypothetical protein